jgi:hypothetical protein
MNATTQPAPPSIDDSASILALGFDGAAVRACLLESISGRCRLAGWLQAPARADAGLDAQAGDLLQEMERRLHRPLWSAADAMPFIASEEPVRLPPLGQVAVTASPQGPVRIWLVGLTRTQSIAAAQEALSACPAAVIGVTLHSADLQVAALADSLRRAEPDLLVITGGYDDAGADARPDMRAGRGGEADQPLYELARVLAPVLARTAPMQRPAVIFAGNRWAAAGVAEIMQAAGAGAVEVVDNVQPRPGLLHAAALAQAVNFAYWRLCRRQAGLREISRWVTAPGHIATLESCFAQLVQVWLEMLELPSLHALYCGPRWWLHVAAVAGRTGLQMRYTPPNSRPADGGSWPPLQLVSGEWPAGLWPRPPVAWCDRRGLAPLLAAAGQVAPQAMIEALAADVLEPVGEG